MLGDDFGEMFDGWGGYLLRPPFERDFRRVGRIAWDMTGWTHIIHGAFPAPKYFTWWCWGFFYVLLLLATMFFGHFWAIFWAASA